MSTHTARVKTVFINDNDSEVNHTIGQPARCCRRANICTTHRPQTSGGTAEVKTFDVHTSTTTSDCAGHAIDAATPAQHSSARGVWFGANPRAGEQIPRAPTRACPQRSPNQRTFRRFCLERARDNELAFSANPVQLNAICKCLEYVAPKWVHFSYCDLIQ